MFRHLNASPHLPTSEARVTQQHTRSRALLVADCGCIGRAQWMELGTLVMQPRTIVYAADSPTASNGFAILLDLPITTLPPVTEVVEVSQRVNPVLQAQCLRPTTTQPQWF